MRVLLGLKLKGQIMVRTFKDHVDSKAMPRTRVFEQIAEKCGKKRQTISHQYLRPEKEVFAIEFEGRRYITAVLYDLGEV